MDDAFGRADILVNAIAPGITVVQTVKDNAPAYLEEVPKTAAVKQSGEARDMASLAFPTTLSSPARSSSATAASSGSDEALERSTSL